MYNSSSGPGAGGSGGGAANWNSSWLNSGSAGSSEYFKLNLKGNIFHHNFDKIYNNFQMICTIVRDLDLHRGQCNLQMLEMLSHHLIINLMEDMVNSIKISLLNLKILFKFVAKCSQFF